MTTSCITRTFSSRLPWIGVVQVRASVSLTAPMNGRITAIDVPDQTPVQRNRVIMALGGPLVASMRARLEAAVQSLRSQFTLADDRARELERIVEAELVTKDRLVAAQARRLDLQGRFRDAQLALEAFEKRTQATAPMAGVFTHRRVSPGQFVEAGQVLGEIVDIDHLRILAAVHPPCGATLVGRPVEVRLGADDGIVGTIQGILPQADPNGATQVWIGGRQIDRRLRPGRTVAGEVTLATRSAPAVPVSAVLYDADEKPYVFVHAGRDDRRRPVRVGETQDGWIEVLSGLEAGERVVTQGAYELFHHEFKKQFSVAD